MRTMAQGLESASLILLETDTTAQEIDEILKDVAQPESFGPELSSKVADAFSNTTKRPLNKELFSKLRDKIKVPANCKSFQVPKMNPEIWRVLPSQPRLFDVQNQQTQQALSAGLSSFALIAESVSTSPDISQELKNKILRYSIDAANVLGNQMQTVAKQRRFGVRRFLNPEYGGICNQDQSIGEWLFGDKLSETLKESKASSSIVRLSTLSANRFSPYGSSRGRSLNFRRPFSYGGASYGNGRYQRQGPQFQSRGRRQQRPYYPGQNQSQQPFGNQNYGKQYNLPPQ